MSGPDDLSGLQGTRGSIPFSEVDLANTFSTTHKDDLRYCHMWLQWLIWKETRWKRDQTVRVFDLAKTVIKDAAARCNQSSRKIESAATIAAVVKIASADPRHATMPEDWDKS